MSSPEMNKGGLFLKKRLFSLIMSVMLAFSAVAASHATYTAYASAGYANSQLESYAREVAGIVNRERAANGLSPLKFSERLSLPALVRAEEIQTAFSHTRPNGSRCFTAITEADISYRSAGENIAYGQRTPEEVMNSWMNSSGHRANILGNYEYIGIGVAFKNGTYYWTQFFATSDDLSGETVTLGSHTTTASTTESTKTTTASTTRSTKATTVSTTKSTKAATASTTKSTEGTASATTQASKNRGGDCNTKEGSDIKSRVIRFLSEKFGVRINW